jgi:phage shock protein PspC (stress-responsive transcriptional regulator)
MAASSSSRPAPLARASSGRWLAGVCAGLGRFRGLPVGWLRTAFALGALVGGLGILVYVACWLIVPAEGDEDTATTRRGIVVLAQACAACVGLGTLGAFGAAATMFGFGWVVLALAVTGFVGALLTWTRVGSAWAVLPVAALALPSMGVAAGGVRLAAQSGEVQAAPATADDLPHGAYRSGLGRMLVDLRRTALPPTGTIPLRIEAGVRRTIVALPHDRCVHVDVTYRIAPFAARVAGLISGRRDRPFSAVVVFGRHRYNRSGETGNLDRGGRGPTLKITFNSEGGGLYVRDYPNVIDADVEPDWPGYRVWPELRPDTTGTPKRAARALIHNWRIRHRNQVRSGKRVAAQLPGPCAAKDAKP